jgi:hypothetical protein
MLVLILVVPLGFLLAMVWRMRHRNDPMGERAQAFAALRRMAESPRVQLNQLVERMPVVSGHVRILSERPAGLPRPRRQLAARRARTGTQRRRALTPAHPKLAFIPTAPNLTSSSGTTTDKTSRGRDIELTQPSTLSDRDRVAADVEANATAEGPTNRYTVRVTPLRGEAKALRGEIAEKHPTSPVAVKRSGDASRSRRRAGGSHDALDAAVKRAVNHADGMTDHTQTDELKARLLGVAAKSA